MKLPIKHANVMKWLALVVALSVTSSCGTDGDERPVYQGAEYYKNLEVPPDLTQPDTGDQLRVPKPTKQSMQRFRDNNKLDTVITPKFDGVRMVSSAGNSWIEIDNTVEHVWSKLLDFWQAEGIELAEKRPLLGFMETEWIERADADAGFFRSMFQKFEPDVKDKFRVRLTRFADGKKTRLTIAHSRIERILYGEESDEFIWESRPSDVEAEREMISRMALFAGKSKEATVQLLQNYRPYTSLVKMDTSNTTALTMKGNMDFVWSRAVRALDRMRAQDIREQKENNRIQFVVGKLSNEELKVEEDDEDELAKSSWLMQLFTSVDEKKISTDQSRQYSLEFSDLGGRVQIEVNDAKNSQTTDDDGDTHGTALAEQLRNLLAEKLE